MDEKKKLADALKKELAGRGRAPIPPASLYRMNRENVSGLRASGWSYAAIAALLSANGSTISPAALRIYAARDALSLDPREVPKMKECPAPVFTKRRLVESLAPLILEAKESGMSWEEIARQLKTSGFSIKPATLRIYAYPAISGLPSSGEEGGGHG